MFGYRDGLPAPAAGFLAGRGDRPLARGLLALMALVSAAPARAQTGGPAASETFQIDPRQSEVRARVRFFGLASKSAQFPKVTGHVQISPDRLQNIQLDVVIDATALQADDGLTTSRLRGTDFFDVAKFPTIHFRGEHLEQTGATTATIDGTLTARGITRPVRIAATFSKPLRAIRPGDALDIAGDMKINRVQFGMTAYALIVGREVTVSLKAHVAPHAPAMLAGGVDAALPRPR